MNVQRQRRSRRTCAILLFLWMVCLGSPATAQNSVSVESAAAVAGSTVPLAVLIQNDVDIVAFSFGLIHAPGGLTPIFIEYAGPVVADFVGTSSGPEGLAMGVLVDFELQGVIAAGGPRLVAVAGYEANSSAQGTFATVTPGSVGDPVTDVVFALPDASEIIPDVISGGVAILTPINDGTPTNRVRVAFDGSASFFSPDGVLVESEVTADGAPTDLLVNARGETWILMAETQTLCRVGINPQPKIVCSTGPNPIGLGPLGGDGVFVIAPDGIQVLHPDGTVLYGGDGAGDSPEDGVLGGAQPLGISVGNPGDSFHYAVGTGNTSWIAVGTTLARIQSDGSPVVIVSMGSGNTIRDLVAGPDGSVFLLFTDRIERRMADGSMASSCELPPAIAPTRMVGTIIGGGEFRVDRLAILNPSANQVLMGDYDFNDALLLGPVITHPRGVDDIAWDGDRQLWIAGQEPGSGDGTLTSYNADGSATGVDLTFPGETILLTEHSAAVPVAHAFPDDDDDGDQYSNIDELAQGSNPYDASSDPSDVDPLYIPPMNSLSSVIIDDNHFVEVSWTWSDPAGNVPDFYQLTRTSDGVEGNPVEVPAGEFSWIDTDVPEGTHTYTGIVILDGGGSGCLQTTIVVGSGETETETPIEIPGSVGMLTEIYDITAVFPEPPEGSGEVFYYATDSLNGQIYALGEDFQVLAVVPSPFEENVPVTGIAYIPDGDAGNGSLVVGNGNSGGQMHLMEMTRQGEFLRNYFVYNPSPWAPGGGNKFLPGAIEGKSGGMGFNPETETLYVTGPDTCEIYGIAHEGDGGIDSGSSFEHPNEGAQQKGCTSGRCPTTGFVGCGPLPLYITSVKPDGSLEIIEVTVSGGVATQVGEGISLAAIDDPGGILFDGENFVVAGNTDGTVYEIQATGSFIRADANEDNLIDIGDAISILGMVITPAGQPPLERPECEARLDANDDNLIDIGDPIFVLNYLFIDDSPPPPPPFDVAGGDPTPSSNTPCP